MSKILPTLYLVTKMSYKMYMNYIYTITHHNYLDTIDHNYLDTNYLDLPMSS